MSADWEEVGDLNGCTSSTDVGDLLARTCPDEAPGTVDDWEHQLWRFITMETGDLVVRPRKYLAVVAIGRLTGGYEYRSEATPGFRHTRKVEWVRTQVERAAIGGDLRDSIGAFLTVSGLRRRDAAHRVETLAQTGVDPGYKGAVAPTPPVPPAAATAQLREDIRAARAQVNALLKRSSQLASEAATGLSDDGSEGCGHLVSVRIDQAAVMRGVSRSGRRARRTFQRSRSAGVARTRTSDRPRTRKSGTKAIPMPAAT